MAEQQHRRLVVNVLSNYGTLGLYNATHFVLVGYIMRRLGKDALGVITLALSLTVIMELLGRAVSYSLTKHVSAEMVRKEDNQANAFINASLAWFLLCAGAGGLACGFVAMHIERLCNIPPALVRDARWAMWLIALRVLVCFPFNTFQGILFAYQRYDLANLAKSATVILHFVAVIAYFEWVSAGVVSFVMITTAALVVERLLWLWFSRTIAVDMRIDFSLISRRAMIELFCFGGFVMVIYVANLLGYEATKWVIGLELTVADVGGYGLIAALAVAGGVLVRSISTVLMPVASKYYAMQAHETNSRLTLLATKYAMIVSGALFLMPLLLLKPLLTLWVGDEYAPGYLDMLARAGIILFLGEWSVTTVVCILQILSGIGRVRFPALVTLAWALSSLMGVWAYLHWWKGSLLGAVVVITTTRCLSAVLYMVHGLKVLNIRPGAMFAGSILRPTAAGLACCAAGYGLVCALNVYRPLSFLLATAVLTCMYGALVWAFVLSGNERTRTMNFIGSAVNRRNRNVHANTVEP